MRVELIAIGSELVRFGRRDTNSEWLTERLQQAGIEVGARSLVDDDVERLSAAIVAASARTEVVLLTGGLGPTDDDRTRQALARAVLPTRRSLVFIRSRRLRPLRAARSSQIMRRSREVFGNFAATASCGIRATIDIRGPVGITKCSRSDSTIECRIYSARSVKVSSENLTAIFSGVGQWQLVTRRRSVPRSRS